jgi:peptidoglycan/xylan/chitin deacetylase (PgdA/CDA1 family)
MLIPELNSKLKKMNKKRIDKLVTHYPIFPLIKLLRLGNSHLPVLMYHSIADNLVEKGHPYFWVNTTPSVFREHMQFLQDNNYQVVDIEKAFHRSDQQVFSRRSVVITFDDGFHDFYENAFPVLNDFGYTATMFLPTSYIEASFKMRRCLTWEEVRELYRYGITFGSHTVTHPQLHNLSVAEIDDELRQSKEVIEDNIGDQIDSFCYPYAFPEQDHRFKKIMKELLAKNEYRYSHTTIIGRAEMTEPYLIKRLPANSDDDLEFFKAKLEGAYDWLHYFQYGSKVIKDIKSLIRGVQLNSNEIVA